MMASIKSSHYNHLLNFLLLVQLKIVEECDLGLLVDSNCARQISRLLTKFFAKNDSFSKVTKHWDLPEWKGIYYTVHSTTMSPQLYGCTIQYFGQSK